MNEKPTETEKHAVANTRGILMPAHQVRVAIGQAVARGQLTEEDGEEIFWLYSYAQEYHLKEGDLAASVELGHATSEEREAYRKQVMREETGKAHPRLSDAIAFSRSNQRLILEGAHVDVPSCDDATEGRLVVSPKRTFEAASAYARTMKTCVLNFASASNPGGGDCAVQGHGRGPVEVERQVSPGMP